MDAPLIQFGHRAVIDLGRIPAADIRDRRGTGGLQSEFDKDGDAAREFPEQVKCGFLQTVGAGRHRETDYVGGGEGGFI